MNEYIKGFNDPFLEFETQERVRVVNINEIRDVEINKTVDRAWIMFKDSHYYEIPAELGYAISNFIMRKTKQVVAHMDVDLAHETQTMNEWLDENGQK